MHATVFDSFAQVIEAVPTKDLFNVLERECQMLENDPANSQDPSADDAISIETFRFFLKAARKKQSIPFVAVLPRNQLVFYRKTVERLIEAGQLPPEVRKQFAETFSVRPVQLSGLVQSCSGESGRVAE